MPFDDNTQHLNITCVVLFGMAKTWFLPKVDEKLDLELSKFAAWNRMTKRAVIIRAVAGFIGFEKRGSPVSPDGSAGLVGAKQSQGVEK